MSRGAVLFGLSGSGRFINFIEREIKMVASKIKKVESGTVCNVTISAPRFETAVFSIRAMENVPMVAHRFSLKTQNEMRQKMEAGSAGANKKKREQVNMEDRYNEARYISKDGWDGFPCSAIRKACIRACSLVGFKMVQAKMSIFCIADGVDAEEPQIQLVRIYGKPVMQIDTARVETGQPYVVARPAYHNWTAKVKIRWDADQFTLGDISNLLMRVGQQVGLLEGRPSSDNSAGMGWGLFELVK